MINDNDYMTEMTQKEFYSMNSVLRGREFTAKTKNELFRYWKKRVLNRINYLEPLINELLEKEISLISLSKSLYEEWKELKDANMYYQFEANNDINFDHLHHSEYR